MALNGDRIIDRIMDKVDDPDMDHDLLLERLNEGMSLIATRCKLPDLEEVAQVTTVLDGYSIPLPLEYHSGLFSCRSALDNRRIKLMNNKAKLLAVHSDLTSVGDVAGVCVSGQNLLYQPIPTVAETLTLSFYRKPVDFTEDTAPDGISGICLHDGQEALYHYGCWYGFEKMEDGVEGAMPNSDKHWAKFENHILALEDITKESQSHPSPPVVTGCFK